MNSSLSNFLFQQTLELILFENKPITRHKLKIICVKYSFSQEQHDELLKELESKNLLILPAVQKNPLFISQKVSFPKSILPKLKRHYQ
jgi:hypothetical protein